MRPVRPAPREANCRLPVAGDFGLLRAVPPAAGRGVLRALPVPDVRAPRGPPCAGLRGFTAAPG